MIIQQGSVSDVICRFQYIAELESAREFEIDKIKSEQRPRSENARGAG